MRRENDLCVPFQIATIKGVQQKKDPLKQVPSIEAAQGIQLHPKAEKVLLPSFIWGIFGGPGAGKTSLIEHLLLEAEFFGGRFQRVLFIGPTMYKKLVQDEDNHCKYIDMTWIMGKIKQANRWYCRSMLIIMDDVVASMKGQNDPRFTDLFYNRRHLLDDGAISILFTSQKWNMAPVFVRCALNKATFFPQSKGQIQIILRQLKSPLPRKTLSGLFSSLQRHQFLYFNLIDQQVYNYKWELL